MFSWPVMIKSPHSTGSVKEIFNPNDGLKIADVTYGQASDLSLIKDQILKHQKIVSNLKAFERAEILMKLMHFIKNEAEHLANIIATEGGKPIRDARIEVERAQTTIELCAEEAKRLGGEMIPMEKNRFGVDHLSFTSREPIGPVFAICAFNHPLNLICHQVGTSFAAGNTTLFKPAPSTPVVAHLIENFFKSINAEFVMLNIHLEIPEIELMLSWSGFKFIQFIGSTKVGWTLPQKVSQGTRMSLELGGRASALICEDADLKLAISSLVKSSFTHSGQVCISTQKIFVHEKIMDQFKKTFVEEVLKLKCLNARLEEADTGPMIRESEAIRVESWFQEAVSEGAVALLQPKRSKNYLTPGILLSPSHHSKVMREEIFGPLVCLISYKAEDDVIQHLDQEDCPFEHCLFTQDITRALKLSKQIKAQTIVVNNHNAYRVDWMPFGGHEKAGLGMGGVRYAIEEMTKLKQTVIRS